MKRARATLSLVAALALTMPAAAVAGHGLLDHPAPSFSPGGPPSSEVNAGGPGAEWELIETISTGNPHTDLDFFTQAGETYASVGTLAVGPNGGGQTIVKLTEGDVVDPSFVSSQPSATCISDPSAALGLQHDVEATPKGAGVPLNARNPSAVREDAQLLIDATDAAGRCHDQGVLGLQGAPLGGLEIIDIADVTDPVEIGLTSHIGETHTVNIDPKRPHIAYSSTSDAVSVSADDTDVDGDGDTTEMIRENEDPEDSDRFDLDGFEVVDLSSCMGFGDATTLDVKRTMCRPEVYRYRYPTAEMALGHTIDTGASAIFGCHELEVYPDDRLTCGSGNALIALDMSGAFRDMGTPNDFTDDKPRGTPLPCKLRPSSSAPPFTTTAMVADCVDGTNDADPAPGGVGGEEDLTVPGWLASGAPSLEGVEYLGSIYHQGGGPGGADTGAPFNSKQDIAFDHEAELSGSGDYLIATDERGGGVLPPGATCSPGVDNVIGNGGVSFYKTSALSKTRLDTPEEAQQAYAKTPDGDRAIFRAQVRTKAQASICTAHVLQQIPGENRIFMGWYSQGTQVIDFVEEEDGRIRFAEAGYMIPESANTWVSHIFKTEDNPDGSTTYYGATGDFLIGEAGRNSIDVYSVTLPPAPEVVGGGGGGGGGGTGAGRCSQSLRGSPSADSLLGSIAGDRIDGRKGNDRLKGRAGDDCIKGGAGNDRLAGGDDDDTLNGGGGNDRLGGGDGDDSLKAGKAVDRLGGGKGKDRLRSRDGSRDVVDCGKGRDVAIVDGRDRVRGCERVKGDGRR